MPDLSAKIRNVFGKNLKPFRFKGSLPAVLYGPKIKPLSLEIDAKEFEKIYKTAGENTLVSIRTDAHKYLVLINEVQLNSLTGKPTHVDFYQPDLKEKVQVSVPLVFEGAAPAIKESGGTFVKNISEIEVRALPQNLPHEIKVDISCLKKFQDRILIKDLTLPDGVEISRSSEDIICQALAPERTEEELEKPVEEKIEEVEKIEKKKEEELSE